MTGRKSRRKQLEYDMSASPVEVGEFLAAFGRQRTSADKKVNTAKAKAPPGKQTRSVCPIEMRWLAAHFADEKEKRRLARLGLPPRRCTKTWREISDG